MLADNFLAQQVVVAHAALALRRLGSSAAHRASHPVVVLLDVALRLPTRQRRKRERLFVLVVVVEQLVEVEGLVDPGGPGLGELIQNLADREVTPKV